MRWDPLRAVLLALAAAAGAGIALGAQATTSSPATKARTRTVVETVTETVTTTVASPPPSAPPRPGVAGWPARSGWTDVLASIPAPGGRPEAATEAHAALRAGLHRVGILLSAQHGSLRSGYWVVFSGVYASEARAQTAVGAARTSGFAEAYPRFVSSS